jgi:RES domain-containing protein
MRVWRLFKREFSANALTGWGAREYGGRWNSKGVAMVYCSGSLALAVLETLVHLDDYDLLRSRFAAIWIDVPDGSTLTLSPATLPQGWSEPGCTALRGIGNGWVASTQSVALMVPSVIIPQEQNVLLNPCHPDFASLTTGPVVDFHLDPRLDRRSPLAR